MGAVYALVALGLALIYGVLHIINFAHGSLLMMALYATYFLFRLGGLSEVTSALLGQQPGVNLLAFGLLLLIILRFLPNGLMGLLHGRS